MSPTGPHWWDEFHAPDPRPVRKKRTGPRLAVIGTAMGLIILAFVLTTPGLSSLVGN